MKSIIIKLCALIGAATCAHAAPVLFPNGGFETPAGASWTEASGGITYSYPTSGGNPNGYGVMDATNGQWAIWVGNGDAAITLSSLGLSAGNTYNFKQDMRILTGANVGGFKIDFVPSGSTGDIRIPKIGDGMTWATYTYPIAIPAGTTAMKIVPLWGVNSSVGYDNILVDNTPVAPPAPPTEIPNGNFETPGGASWTQVSGGITYSYPATGGNPNGYGVMDATNGQWAIWVANSDAALAIGPLGLTAGNTYNFKQDMRILSGTNVGGFKVDFIPSGSTGDIRIPKIGDGLSWATYTYPVTIPPGTTAIKVVPLWGPNSSVGYDNITVNTTPVVLPPDQIPNGDFEIAGGASWGTTQGTPSFPTTGGNPNGHAVLDGTAGFAVLYAFNNTEKPFAPLGLAPGDNYTVRMDMKLISGTNIGGLRLEGPAGYVIESYPTLIGDGSTWQTYSIQLTVPTSPTQTKFGLRPGAGSVVAFDNVMIVLPVPAAPPQPKILIGKMVNWTPTVPANFYQAQESTDDFNYTNLGPAYVGTSVSSVFDPTPAPFYRVQESAPVLYNAAFNGGFESEFFGEPEGWTLAGSQAPLLISTDAQMGSNSMDIMASATVANPGPPATYNAGVSILEQNTTNAGSNPITPGSTYNFSFWAKQVSAGPGYVQQFKVTWLDGIGAIVGDGGIQVFSGAIGVWEKKTQNGLVAPAGAVSAQILIQGVTGAFDGSAGQVYIDTVALETTTSGTPATIASTSASAAEISWQSVSGQNYQVRSSTDLSGWSPFGGAISGNGSIKAVYDTPLVTKKFYQLGTQ